MSRSVKNASPVEKDEPVSIQGSSAATAHQKSKLPSHRRAAPPLLFALISILALIVLLHTIAIRRTAIPFLSPTNCADLIRTNDYTQSVHLQSQSQEMGAIQFSTTLIPGQPSAIVQVMSSNSQHALNIYVFGCTLQRRTPVLKTLFSQQDLLQGTVSLSSTNTLITSQIDPNISDQAATLLQPQQQNIYREYGWYNNAFVELSFPGLYPVTTRSEAEALQQQANNNQSLPWNDPLITAEQMGKDILKWQSIDPQNTVLSNDGFTSHVKLVQENPHFEVNVTLKRLIQQDNRGLWFVTAAQTSSLILDQLAGQPYYSSIQPSSVSFTCSNSQEQSVCDQPTTSVTSPFAIQGTGASANSQISAALFDHTLTPISTDNIVAVNTNGNGLYTGTLSYKGLTPDQHGLLLLQSLPPFGSSGQGQILIVDITLK